jgi:hypothetical protein
MSRQLQKLQEHFDSNESMFLQRQLDYIKSQTYDIKYAELKARKLIPVSSEADPGAEKIFYRQYDQSGLAKIVANYGDDLPRADVSDKEFSANVKTLGDSYGYNVIEMRNAAYGNVPLEQRRSNAARRAIAQLENSIAFFGDTASGLLGFFNAPNITSVSIPNDGTGASKAWSTKTPDQILRDMNLIANTVVSTSLGIEIPDTMLLPLVNYNYVASTARSANSDTTILNYFLQNNPYIKEVEWVNELATAGSGSVTRSMAYRRSPEVLTMEVPSDFEQLELQILNLEYKVPCIERFAGVLVYYPLAIAFGDGC